MLAEELRNKLYCTGYTARTETSADVREILRYAYRFRASLNAAIESAERDLVQLADTPELTKHALDTLGERA